MLFDIADMEAAPTTNTSINGKSEEHVQHLSKYQSGMFDHIAEMQVCVHYMITQNLHLCVHTHLHVCVRV